jgi:hypothetical protein
MATYHNAVSDKLVVSFYPKATFYHVYTKDHHLKWCMVQDKPETPSELEGAIFSKTTCINSVENVVLTPLHTENVTEFYSLNYAEFEELHQENLEKFAVVQNVSGAASSVIKKLVNPEISSDVSVLFKAVSQSSVANALYFYSSSNKVNVMVFKDGGLQLVNRYPAENQDELFYYIMLVVEQLELPVNNLHFECIASSGVHENLQSLFKNYLPTLHLIKMDVDFSYLPESLQDHKSDFIQASYFSQCVL